MNPTRVVNVRGQAHDPELVYVGRGSEWGNPFSHRPSRYPVMLVATREEAIERYRAHLWERIRSEGRALVYQLSGLYGQTLGCYCAPASCHGDVLAAAAEWAENEVRNIETAA